jgi:glycine/D-amino acid oxidase-like deaminating enzyme
MAIHDTHIGSHSATGWWLEEADGADPRPPLSGALEADVVVIGGGYTGMWTAWHLLEADPSARVVVLEGALCGHGPSGRNGGFCESMWFSAPALRERFGDSAARSLLEASSRAVSDIGAWCAVNHVDAWFDQSGYMCVSTGEAFDEVGRAAVAAAAELGAPEAVQALSAEQVRERCTSPVFGRGVFIPDFATVQPARLARGLRRRLVERGVQVFERSRVRGLRAGRAGANGGGPGGTVSVETAGGSVRASAAVLAVGPAARSIRPLRSRLSVTSSHIVLTEPVPDLLEEIGWTGGECITDGRTLLHYFRTTRDGRIAFGWGGGRLAYGARLNGRLEVDRQVAAEVIDSLERIFPGVRGRRITHAWGGPIDVSPSHIPQIGTLPGAPVHYALGFTGNGVGPSHLAGRALAALALDRRDEYTRLPIVGAEAGAWVPPEPLAFVGGSAVRSALLRVEKSAEKGERASPLTRAVCAAPRALGMHLAR